MPQDGLLSTVTVAASFVGARSMGVTRTVDYEDGGVAIQDPSRGLLYQRWRVRLLNSGKVDSKVLLGAANLPEFDWFVRPNITEVSLAFDQNMRPHLAFVQDGAARLYWYDSQVEGMVTTDLGVEIRTPRITMDDKRFIASNGYLLNDIVLAYVRDGKLCTRMQRERFSVEVIQAENIENGLIKIGINRQLRLQFMFSLEGE